jgi:hypothetical protein
MAIVQELNDSYFIDRFKECGRGDNFSYEALEALYNYLDDLSEDMGEDIKLDVIALCCEWQEDSATSIANDYSIDIEDLNEDDIHLKVLEYLEENTYAIDCGDTILYYNF